MSTTEETRRVLQRWYDDMWFAKNWELVSELAGPVYTRHETHGTAEVTTEDYQAIVRSVCESMEITDGRYRLIVEDDHAAAIGSWKLDGKQWDWVQSFRVADGRLVETWLSGVGTESNWAEGVF